MLEHGRAKILASELVNETTIRLQLDNVSQAIVGEVIEDKSAVLKRNVVASIYKYTVSEIRLK